MKNCPSGTSIYDSRPLCYPENFCPLDTVGPKVPATASGPNSCEAKCSVEGEIPIMIKEVADGEGNEYKKAQYECYPESDCTVKLLWAKVETAYFPEGQCMFCKETQFYVYPQNPGEPGSCVDECLYRNMTSPKEALEKEAANDPSMNISGISYPVGFCELPSSENPRCPFVYNSS